MRMRPFLFHGARILSISGGWNTPITPPPTSPRWKRLPMPRAILDEWVDRGNVTLAELVTHVLIHEFAHHFGWSDDDIAAVDRWWE